MKWLRFAIHPNRLKPVTMNDREKRAYFLLLRMSNNSWGIELKYTSPYWINRSKMIETILNTTDKRDFEKQMNEMIIQDVTIKTIIKNPLKNQTELLKKSNVLISGSTFDQFNQREFEQSLYTINRNMFNLISKRIERMALELNIPIFRIRSPNEISKLVELTDESNENDNTTMSIMCDIFPSKLWDNDYLKTCLYDDMDLFDALRAIRCKQNDLGPSLWSAISIPIKTDTLLDLRKKYKELCSYQVQHLGLHNIEDTTEEYSKFHSDLGENLLGTQDLQKLGQYAKRGISDHLRPKIWNLLLQSEVIGCYRSYVQKTISKLSKMIKKMDLIIDRMIQIDSKHAQNDDGYFIFEDLIKKIMMYWSRDNWITKALMKMNHELLAKDLYSEQGYNGIYPFWGISLYAMPVCYLHEDPGEAYILFRELYVRYFYKLHTPCNKNGGILQLCIQFENLVKETNSELYFHLSHTIEIQPLEIAFKWILYAFVGILDCEQVLLMWDRIIGYDCLGLLSVTAAALLTYRSDLLFMCKTPNQVMKCFDDCGMIKWVPLVQKFLKE